MPRGARSVLLIALLLIGLLPAVPPVPARASSDDPAALGPHDVLTGEYDYGDSAFRPRGFPSAVELRGFVHYPADLSGPLPLIVFLHGRHRTCYAGTRSEMEWPCDGDYEPIPNHRGHGYLARLLASHGFIVASISANGINAADHRTADRGAGGRGQLVLKHLDLWSAWNAGGGGEFGRRFAGKVDLTRVGLLGHSRGGEGVAAAVLQNAAEGSRYGIRGVLLLAPQDYSRLVLNHVPLAVLLPYCDGDVSSLRGVHYYDDARYSAPGDRAPKHAILLMGANHNYFNTVWTPGLFPAATRDDWLSEADGAHDPHCGTVPGNGRLPAVQQRSATQVFGAAFFRAYLHGDARFAPLLAGAVEPPPAVRAAVHVSYHPPDEPSARRDVNRYLDHTALSRNALGGTVEARGLSGYELCGGAELPGQCLPGTPRTQQPHSAPRTDHARPGLSQVRLAWHGRDAVYRNELPPGTGDVAGFTWLQFRAAVNFAAPANPVGESQDFRVVLIDGAGRSAAVRVGEHTAALYYPPGANSRVPKLLLNTVRIPLGAFQGIDMRDVRAIEFRFDQRPSGELLVTDLAFASLAAPAAS